ncbi:MAG: ATP-binding protein [Polyangiaceae bacterium]
MHFEKLLGALAQPVLVIDGDGAIIWANDALRRAAQHGEPHLLRDVFAEKDAIAITTALRSEGDKHLMLTLAGMRGDWRVVSLGEGTVGLLGPEPSGRRQSQRELASLLRTAAHDLTGPARQAVSFCNLLESRVAGSLDERSLEFLDRAKAAAHRLEKLADGMVAYGEAGEGQGHGQADLGRALERVCRELRASIEERKAVIHIQGSAPPLACSQAELHTVLWHVLHNALIYAEPGVAPVISVRAESAGPSCLVEIEDNGPGIPSAQQQSVFDPFRRFHRHDEVPGNGLGLAVTRQILERSGGGISVASEPGRTVFVLRLPCRTSIQAGAASPS